MGVSSTLETTGRVNGRITRSSRITHVCHCRRLGRLVDRLVLSLRYSQDSRRGTFNELDRGRQELVESLEIFRGPVGSVVGESGRRQKRQSEHFTASSVGNGGPESPRSTSAQQRGGAEERRWEKAAGAGGRWSKEHWRRGICGNSSRTPNKMSISHSGSVALCLHITCARLHASVRAPVRFECIQIVLDRAVVLTRF